MRVQLLPGNLPGVLAPLVILPLVLGFLFGCSGSESGATTSAPRTDAADGSGGGSSPQILALQSAAEASLRHDAGDDYVLTMTEPSEKTLYFTDSPGRNARRAPARALPTWLEVAEARDGTAPNATVTWPEGPEGVPSSMVARLAGASYREGDGSLRFSLRALRLASGEPATVGPVSLDADRLARGPATIVIDGTDGTGDRFCSAGLDAAWESDLVLDLASSELEHGEWNDRPPASINLKYDPNAPVASITASSDGFMTGCQFSVRYADDKGNSIQFGVDSPFIGDGSHTFSCSGEVSCKVEGGSSGGILVLDVG